MLQSEHMRNYSMGKLDNILGMKQAKMCNIIFQKSLEYRLPHWKWFPLFAKAMGLCITYKSNTEIYLRLLHKIYINMHI